LGNRVKKELQGLPELQGLEVTPARRASLAQTAFLVHQALLANEELLVRQVHDDFAVLCLLTEVLLRLPADHLARSQKALLQDSELARY